MKRRAAIPEVIDPGDWKVEEGKGECNLNTRMFRCPQQTDPHNRAVAVHELLHVRFSDKDISTTDSNEEFLAVRLFEDIRISWLGMRMGLGDVLIPILEKVENVPPLFGTMLAKPFGVCLPHRLQIRDQMLADRYGNLIKENMNSSAEVARLAREFAHQLPEIVSQDSINSVIEMYINNASYVANITETENASDDFIKEMIPQFATAPIIRLKMTIKDVRRSTRRSDTGYLLRHPERIVTDRLCFTEPRRPPTVGTILIDCSGSMNIDREEIVRITKTTNGATIAGYCSQDRDGRLGAVWGFSERGKVARVLPDSVVGNRTLYNSGTRYNCCDLPALMWLTKQRRPWVWVSDGHVNGYEGRQTKDMKKVCYGAVRRFGIKRLGNLVELAKYLEEMER
jgi:hypothetical protein